MYLNNRFYLVLVVVILTIASGYTFAPMFIIGRILLLLLVVVTLIDVMALYDVIGRLRQMIGGAASVRQSLRVVRTLSPRFSNGDENPVSIRLESTYGFRLRVEVIDEIPFVFQRRDVCFKVLLSARGDATVKYMLRPTQRGVYGFGHVRVFIATPLGFAQRRFTCCEPQNVKVYPSYLMLRQYELLAMSNNLTEMGIKRIRRIGNNTDFEQIKDYVVGDDYRTINWRATARRHQLMVNVYQEERAQQVFSVIDKGRMMQQTFAVTTDVSSAAHRMTLLDYAINASLVLSFVAVNKQDKAGLVTFSDRFETYIPASRQSGQMQILQEALYAERTQFGETDYSALLAGLSRHVTRRSLLILYTSFMSMTALRRQLSYLRQLAQRHRLLVVFFEDEELRQFAMLDTPRSTLHSYQRVIAEKFLYEQRLVVSVLRQYGIQSLLTSPQNLSVNVINKYLEMKSR